MKQFLLSILIISLSLGAARVNCQTWIGGVGDWDVASNWSTSSVPTSTSDVIIGNGGVVTIPISFAAVASTIEVQSGGSLNITSGASLTINIIGFDFAAMTVAGALDNAGTLTIGNIIEPIVFACFFQGGSLTNSGTFDIYDLRADGEPGS